MSTAPPSGAQVKDVEAGTQPAGPLTTLRAGIGHEREWIRYWADLVAEDDAPA